MSTTRGHRLFVAAALTSLTFGCGSKKNGPPEQVVSTFVLAVNRGADLRLAPVAKLNLAFFAEGGFGYDDEVQLDSSGFFGQKAQTTVDAKDVDGDGKPEGTIEFMGNPFQAEEVSMRIRTTIARPLRITAKVYDPEGLSMEGSVDKDTSGHPIQATAGGTEPVVELAVHCTRATGCVPDGGVSQDTGVGRSEPDASSSPDAAPADAADPVGG